MTRKKKIRNVVHGWDANLERPTLKPWTRQQHSHYFSHWCLTVL